MQRFLVALDGSRQSAAVLAASVDLAKATGARLRLFRAVHVPPELPGAFFGEAEGAGRLDAACAAAREDLSALARDVPAELLDGIDVLTGSAWDATCEAAREHAVDLIVIGARGYSTMQRLLGTTAAKIVDHADRSVLVVRDTQGAGVT